MTTLCVPFAPLAETVDDKTEAAVTVMSLNIYGWKTMPEHSDDYSQLIKRYSVDILGIQEGASKNSTLELDNIRLKSILDSDNVTVLPKY